MTTSFRSFVRISERPARPGEERLGPVDGAIDEDGDRGHGEVVEVAQRQHQSVVRGQAVEDGGGAVGVHLPVPRIVDRVVRVGREVQRPLLALAPPPVVDELVARDPDEPGGIGRLGLGAVEAPERAEEGLRGELFGDGAVAATPVEVAVHLLDVGVVQGQQGV